LTWHHESTVIALLLAVIAYEAVIRRGPGIPLKSNMNIAALSLYLASAPHSVSVDTKQTFLSALGLGDWILPVRLRRASG